MKKRQIKRILIGALNLLLVALMALLSPLTCLASETKPKQYVKDVIFIRAENKNDAKDALPEGYTMIETDLNQGAAYVYAVDDVYLAYSTTENPDEAITDIKMMNMKGGFVLSDYNDQISNVSENVREMATELKIAVDTFTENYKKSTPGAKAAYHMLNCFTVDDANEIKLADYFISESIPDEFYLKLILNAHKDIIACILSALAMAVQGNEGDTWLDRLAKIEDPEEIYNSNYWDQAYALWPLFDDFYRTYSEIDHELFQKIKNDTADEDEDEDNSEYTEEPSLSGIELLYEVAYDTLDSYSFGNGTRVSEWLVNDYLYEEMLYPLIDILTPAEYAMMHLCGPFFMTLATAMSEDVYQDYLKRSENLVAEMDSCSIWHGVNTELFRSSIGITDEASRAIAETRAEQEFNNDGDSSLDDTIKIAGLVAAIGAVSLGVGLITTSLSAGALGAVLTGSTASTFAVATAITGPFFIAAGVVVICVALVIAVVYLVVWLKEWYDEHHPDYTEIPEYMYDLVMDESENRQFVLYEVAKFQDGSPVDVNAWDGKQWHAPYVSRDSAAGNPIEADFCVKLGDGRLDEGFAPLATFGGSHCENLNAYADSDDVKGIFVSFRQQPLKGDFALGKYLSDIKIFRDTNDERCRSKLENERYKLYNLNLSPDSDYYTYLGYKTSNKANLALTDIRLTAGSSSMQYNAGGMNETYAASGSIGSLTLYSTRVSLFGTPILSTFLVLKERNAPEGYEPVNFFSGGNAVNLNVSGRKAINNNNPVFLYFLPSQTFTSATGDAYLGGLATIFDFPQYAFTSGKGAVAQAALDLGYNTLASMSGAYDAEGAVLYSVTYNPYRAIYGVTAFAAGSAMGSVFPETITYDNTPYSCAARFLIPYDGKAVFSGLKHNSNDIRLYTAGIYRGGTPMKIDDLRASSDESFTADGYEPIVACFSGDARPANISNGFNYTYRYGPGGRTSKKMTMSQIYLFARRESAQEGNTLTNLYLASKEDLIGQQDIDCEDLDNFYVISMLSSQGATEIFTKNLNLNDGDNTTYLGYTKDRSSRASITDVLLYFVEDSNEAPRAKIVHNKIVYHLVSDINTFCKENGTNKRCDRVYIYYTTNPAAGSPILDITVDNTPILNGWETVRTQNEKALYDDMDDYEDNMWFIHVKRTNTDPTYISDVVVGWGGTQKEAIAKLLAQGCDYMINKDLNDGCGAASDYVYIGYKRSNDPNAAIRDLMTTHNENVKQFTKNSVTYYKIDGNLNSYTYLFADDIYLYYTKDPAAGAPVVALETSSKPVNKTENNISKSTVLKKDGKNSDLNDGAFGDYIYLIQSKDKSQNPSIASMIGAGSIVTIIVFSIASIGAAFLITTTQRKQKIAGAASNGSSIKSDDQPK